MSDQVTAAAVPTPGVSAPTTEAATVPGTALPAHPEAPGKIDLKAFVEQRYNEKHKVNRATPATTVQSPKPTPPTAPAPLPAPATALGDALAKVEPKPVELAKPVETEKKTSEQDEIAARLARLSAASSEAAQRRKLRERELAADAKSKAAETAHAKEIELARKLEAARTKGSKLAILEAAGYTPEELENSGFVVDLLDEMSKRTAPPTLTEADVEKKIAERLKAAEDERKAAEEIARQRQEADNLVAKEEFYGAVRIEYKAGDYPALKSDKVTQGQLDAFYQQHLRDKPGQILTAKELLDKAEGAIRVTLKAQKERIEKLEALINPKDDKKPTPPAAAVRTITPSVTSDAGDAIKIEPAKRESLRDKEKRLRATVEAQFQARSAK